MSKISIIIIGVVALLILFFILRILFTRNYKQFPGKKIGTQLNEFDDLLESARPAERSGRLPGDVTIDAPPPPPSVKY